MRSVLAVMVGLAVLAPLAPADAQDLPNRRERAARLRAMGQALVASGDPGSAAGYFRDAISADPDDAEAYVALGTVFLDRGSVGNALEIFAAGLRRRPDHAPLHRGYARALLRNGSRDEAATALRALLVRAPGDVQGHVMRAELARERGAWSEALASYRVVVDLAAAGADVSEQVLTDARRYSDALAIVAGGVDPVRGRDCDGTPVRRALARCR